MISLVTACMNRDAHLRQSLPHWLRFPQISEIVIVDWSNRVPLHDLAQLDSRISVLRVEQEPRWILSYAYNFGISHAKSPLILKCDADCLPREEIFSHQPGPGHFYAGYWKSGRDLGKPCVNGQCFFPRDRFELVNGYSEYIRTYGRDDEDFYQRLQRAGCERREIPANYLDFVPHTEEERTSNQFKFGGAATLTEIVERTTTFNEMHNLFLAERLPWGPEQSRIEFDRHGSSADTSHWVRRRESERVIPAEIKAEARLFGYRCVVQQVLKLSPASAQRLDLPACLKLLQARIPQAA